jgi:hypothetical protein
MGSNQIRHNRPVSTALHPRVYEALVALTFWLIVNVWLFFGARDYAELNLAVVSGFLLMALAIPIVIWMTWRSHTAQPNSERIGFQDWQAGDFDTWQSRLSGREAAIQVLLPIAAVALGMTAFGISFYIASSG